METLTKNEWWTCGQYAAKFGLSLPTVHRNLFVPSSPDEPTPAGKTRAVKIGGVYRIHQSEVDRLTELAKSNAEASRTATRRRWRRYDRTPENLVAAYREREVGRGRDRSPAAVEE